MKMTFEEAEHQLLEEVMQRDDAINEKYPSSKGLDSPAMGERRRLNHWWSEERKKLKQLYNITD